MSRFFLLTLALFACDGDAKDTPADTDTEPTPTTFTVSVTLTDLDGEGLVLSLNGEEHEVSGEGTFTFPTALASGANYDVQVVTQPTCPAQRCRVTGGFGTIPGADITGVEVSCDDPRLRAFTYSWGDDTIRVTDDVLSLEEDEVATPRLIAGPATALTGSVLDSLAWDTRRNILYVVTPDAVLAFPDADSRTRLNRRHSVGWPSVMCCSLMILHMSGRRSGGSDDESRARRVQRVGTDPRRTEVVRTSRFNAEDAEFGQEDTEELSAALTTYRWRLSRTVCETRRAWTRGADDSTHRPYAFFKASFSVERPRLSSPCTDQRGRLNSTTVDRPAS
jgi:hypothetical protein